MNLAIQQKLKNFLVLFKLSSIMYSHSINFNIQTKTKKDLPMVPPSICPVILNQESHLLSSNDHFPTKNINIFANNNAQPASTATTNPDEDHDETNSLVPQPMNLIKPEHPDQVNYF